MNEKSGPTDMVDGGVVKNGDFSPVLGQAAPLPVKDVDVVVVVCDLGSITDVESRP